MNPRQSFYIYFLENNKIKKNYRFFVCDLYTKDFVRPGSGVSPAGKLVRSSCNDIVWLI